MDAKDSKSSKCAECDTNSGSSRLCNNCTMEIAREVSRISKAPTEHGTCTFCGTGGTPIVVSLRKIKGCIVCVAGILANSTIQMASSSQAPADEPNEPNEPNEPDESDESDDSDELSEGRRVLPSDPDENVTRMREGVPTSSSSDDDSDGEWGNNPEPYRDRVTRMLE